MNVGQLLRSLLNEAQPGEPKTLELKGRSNCQRPGAANTGGSGCINQYWRSAG